MPRSGSFLPGWVINVSLIIHSDEALLAAGFIFSRVGHVTVSVGFSRLLPNDTPTDVIDRADEALYYAKHNGRNRVDCYESLIESGALKAKEIVKGEVELF